MALSDAEISIVKGMLARGDVQSHIAAYFGGGNSGRISEINTGRRGTGIAAAPERDLPPPGPYFISGRASIRAKETLKALRDLIDETLTEMDDWENRGKDSDDGSS